MFICKNHSFLMSLTKTNIRPDLVCGSWFATHGSIPEVYILKDRIQRFSKIWLQFTTFPSYFPLLPLHTTLGKLKYLSFTVNHLHFPRSTPLFMLFTTWALNIKVVPGSAQMTPPFLSLFLKLQLELTLYSFENSQDRCCQFQITCTCFISHTRLRF